MAEQEGSTGVAPEVKVKAVGMGWVDKSDFKGDPDKWVDADVFLERGETIMPILKKSNERLNHDVTSLRGEVDRLQALLEGSQDSIKALQDFYSESTKRAVKKARQELLKELHQAKKDGDVDAEVAITDELTRTVEALAPNGDDTEDTREPKKNPVVVQKDYTKEPWWQEWSGENSWFGQDKKRTAAAMGIAVRIRGESPELTGRSFLDAVAEELDELTKGNPRAGDSKVEGGRGGASNRSDGAKTFGDLPADAKAACAKQEARLVGEGKSFKTKKEWQTHFVAKYFE